MKKIILITLLSLISSIGFSQKQLSTYTESFTEGIPADWAVFDNGVGQDNSWGITSVPANVYSAPNSAEVLRENIGAGNTSEDWMVTNLQNLGSKQQFRFYTRTNLVGDNGTIYQIRISQTSQTDPSKFTVLQSYTSLQLSQNPTQYEEKIIDLGAKGYNNKNVYIAFVRVFTQPSNQTGGDKWLVDNVRIVPICEDPTALSATNISATSAELSWSGASATVYDIQYGPEGFTLGTGTIIKGVTNPYTVVGLNPSTAYQYYVKSVCGDVDGTWTGPYKFTTRNLGSVCISPIPVSVLPYEVKIDNTAIYGDDEDGLQGSNCGAVPSTTNYLAGNDVFYSYTPTKSGPISITMTPLGLNSANSSLFVYNNCSSIGQACLGGVANSGITPRIVNLNVTANQTYIIVISSSDVTPSITYSLIIQNEDCTPKPTALNASNITLTSADLSWVDNTHSNWEVALQPFGAAIPSGSGTPTSSNPYAASNLTAATIYQYWVRAECSPGSGTYTAWAGPYVFNTLICDPSESCLYTFRMTDSANNGWNGARMEIRQKGITVATIGSTYTSGGGPVDIPVTLCNGVPFDLYWNVGGQQPQQCIVSIINKFGQTIYTKPAGTGSQGEVLYADVVNCTTPVCNIAPINVVAIPTTITTFGATIDWEAPATTAWDIYLVPKGSVPPTSNSTPTYTGVTKPFPVTGLLADHSYDVYVRVQCSPINSPWSAVATFTTLATCEKPTALKAINITTTSATLQWTNGALSDNEWEILLIAANDYTVPPPPPLNPILGPKDKLYAPITSPSPFLATGLDPATIYYYYIRTVCPGNDKSTWAGPIVFNTVTCDPVNKCTYKFVLTDTGNDGWEGARMQVRQNGIIITTLGGNITGGGPTTVNVSLCNNVPFDLYWTIPGTAPEEVGLTIQNPYQDIVYTMVPGTVTPPIGTPPTPVIVYSSIGNCTPPSCPKPTTLTVDATTITQTTANLGWTETGSATQWEVYVVPVGSPAPVNGSPLGTAPPYYTANTNPFKVDGLLPGTAYTFYVRAICSSTDISTWTIINPKTFITKPVNDECDAATIIPVNQTVVCETKVSGSTLGATRSLPNTSPVCGGNTDDDIWYTFVAINPVQIITIGNIVGGTVDINHTLYSGSDCATMTQLYCSNPNVSVAANLIVGNTYKIRVYTASSDIKLSATFDICITTPPPVTNDECITATPTAPNNGLVCNVTAHGLLTGASASSEASTCIGVEDDDVWYSFVANGKTQYFSLLNVIGTSLDLNFGVYSGTCGSLTQLYCSPSGSLEGNYTNFVENQTYFVRVWSNSNVIQDISFDLCIGRILPPITTSDTEYTTQELVEDVFLNTKCAAVTNVTSSTGSNVGCVNGIGSFNGIGSDFPYKDGIVLTTGNVLSVPGPNVGILSEGCNAWKGDTDLEKILENAGISLNSNNASILEFDFVPLANKMSFNFLFSSEEYGTFQCAYSDSFAFILTDLTEGGEPKNLAIVPGSVPPLPISVVTIRNDAFNSGCKSENKEYFGQYYNPPLPPGINPIGAPINFNGLTVPLTAQADLTEGHTYHIKMVIADRADTAYDSAVFLEGGSFNIGEVELGPDLTGENSLCPNTKTTINSNLNPADYTISWLKDDVVIPNETGPTLLVSTPGVYCIKAQFGTSTCYASDCITVEYFQETIQPGTPSNLIDCSAVGTGVFDLTKNTEVILAPYPLDTHAIVYYTSQSDADNGTNPILNPTVYNNISNPQIIYARINNIVTGCYQVITFQISVQDLTPQFTLSGAMAICPEGSTVITVVPTNNSFDPNLVSYIWTFNGNVIANETKSSLAITNGTTGYGTYTVTVNNSGCTSTQSFEITNSNTVWNFTIDAPESLCINETGILTVNVINNTTGAPATYTYTLDNTPPIVSQNNTITIDTPGVYTVSVNILGCENSNSVTVEENTTPFSIGFQEGCNSNDYQLTAIPIDNSFDAAVATYVWSGPSFSPTNNSNTITLNTAGTYTVIVTNGNTCTSTESITVNNIACTIQKGISPNNDGKNDFFDLSTLKVNHLSIFNRYGTKVYELDNYTNQWYGTTNNGKELPDGTYYYVIERDGVESISGWIYVIREHN